MRAHLFLASSALLLAGCLCPRPWSAFPSQTPPSQQYSVDYGTHGWDLYVWECVDGQRRVVYSYSAEMSCSGPNRETSECGGQTPIERQLASERHQPIRQGFEWR